MILLVAITLYTLGGLLAVWGASLLWRGWRQRRARLGRSVTGLKQPRPAVSLLTGLVCVPIGIGLLAAGDSARRGFEGWDDVFDGAWMLGLKVLCWIYAAAFLYSGIRFDPAMGRRRCP